MCVTIPQQMIISILHIIKQLPTCRIRHRRIICVTTSQLILALALGAARPRPHGVEGLSVVSVRGVALCEARGQVGRGQKQAPESHDVA